MTEKLASIALIAALALSWACTAEEPRANPNSAEGHLYVDLDDPLAVDWTAEVVVLGFGGEATEHRDLTMEDVFSTDPSVVEVNGFEAVESGEIQAVQLDLEAVGEGEADLEFVFSIEGETAAAEEQEADEEQALQEEADDADDPENGDDEERADDGSEFLTDSFSLEAREVYSVALSRILDDTDPEGAYGQCPSSGVGLYLMSDLDEYIIQLRMEKIDDRGHRLRGSGKMPFEIDPADAVSIEVLDEAKHLVAMSPKQFGSVMLTPKESGQNFEAHFAGPADISSMEVKLHAVSEHGARIGESTVMAVDELYEVEVIPDLLAELPLCGGGLELNVESMTPAICEVVGALTTTGNPAVSGIHGGHCRLQITLGGAAGGHGLVDDYTYSVEYDW